MKYMKVIQDKLSMILITAGITFLVGVSVKWTEKLRFIWHSDHYYEMIFEKFRSMQDNRDGNKLYVVMENEVSGEVLYVIDILETAEREKWAYVFDVWLLYRVEEDEHGRMYITFDHEGQKYLFLRK